ncbi:nitrite reductase small subunit NirD [Seongchinamella unica]|uniref:Nitrite reductase small subunit NirD n=1 Tax=Seongchinamella unica TaxID=2547392 RepID=A0A4R5LWW7_9GAMM|nr:nitrite reductase small subunit NirD [Seongchinamella unica]TDG15927.1 nitrite reductase small subunit NirD [Seongchinamella unica]
MTAVEKIHWQSICTRDDLVPGSGVCAMVGQQQIALFYLPEEDQQVYALSNRDPIGGANVLSRGIVGDVGGRLVVASPLYKQHFDLASGRCLEEDNVSVEVYEVRLDGNNVLIKH